MNEFEHKIISTILLDEESPLRKRDLTNLQKYGELTVESEIEKYVLTCGQGISLVTTAISRAAFSLELLRTVRQSALNTRTYTLADQIGFAIENYLIRSATIYDRAMIFVNRLLDLGISDTSIEHELIVTNQHVIRSELVPALKKLRKACLSHREERNSIIHHRSYSEEDFDKLALLHAAQSLSLRVGREAPIACEIVEAHTEELLALRINEFEEHLANICKALSALFDGAIDLYYSQRQRRTTSSA